MSLMGWTEQSFISRLFEDGVMAPFKEKAQDKLMTDIKYMMSYLFDLNSGNKYVSNCKDLIAKLRSGVTIDFKAKLYVIERFEDGEPGYEILRVVTDKDCPVDIKESDIELVYPYKDIEFHMNKEKEWADFVSKYYGHQADVPHT
mmetsp:Transcript_31369/g.28558  ORF Transcript_31369/g.28558 Transcript_31369/m.28558 type:complete len:145 (+) Transcript_31369:659-1093(+)